MFHCKTWNENGTQPAPESVIHLNELVVNSQKSTGNKPIIVMCKYVYIYRASVAACHNLSLAGVIISSN